MGGGAWWAAVHGVAKSWTRLSDFTFTFHFHALEKEMATHSSILAWRIPGMDCILCKILWILQLSKRQKQKTQSCLQGSMKLLPAKFIFGDMYAFL